MKAFDAIARAPLILGTALLLIGSIMLSKDHFVISINGEAEIIARKEHPLFYWGANILMLVVGTSLIAYGNSNRNRQT